MTPAKKRRSARNIAADKRRAAGVRRAWEQAREYAKRHGTKPTLAKRLIPFDIDNSSIRESTRKAFVPKKRLRGGKRASQRYDIPKGGVGFRVVIRRADGKPLIDKSGREVAEVRSDSLRIGGGATPREVQKAMRNAAFGVMGADLMYERGLGELEVGGDGGLQLAGVPLELLIEPDDDETPFIEFGDDDE